MKILTALALAFCICSCSQEANTNENTLEPYTTVKFGLCNYRFATFEYDGCEYVGNYFGSPDFTFVHKGNCKYCAARAAKRDSLNQLKNN